MGSWESQLASVCNVQLEPNAAAKRINAETPVANIPAWADPSSDNLATLAHGSSHTTSVSASAYGGRLVFTEIEEAREPGLVASAASKLTLAVQRTLESLVFTRLEAGDDDTVDNGNGGTITVFNTAHPSGGAANNNKGAGALDEGTLDTARQSMRGWLNAAGQPMELDRGPLALVVPPALGDTARKLVQAPAVSSAIIPMANRAITVVETAYLSSTTEFYLVAQDFTPLNLWMPTPPTMRILQDPANRTYSVSVVFEATAYWAAPIQGIYAGNVTVE